MLGDRHRYDKARRLLTEAAETATFAFVQRLCQAELGKVFLRKGLHDRVAFDGAINAGRAITASNDRDSATFLFPRSVLQFLEDYSQVYLRDVQLRGIAASDGPATRQQMGVLEEECHPFVRAYSLPVLQVVIHYSLAQPLLLSSAKGERADGLGELIDWWLIAEAEDFQRQRDFAVRQILQFAFRDQKRDLPRSFGATCPNCRSLTEFTSRVDPYLYSCGECHHSINLPWTGF